MLCLHHNFLIRSSHSTSTCSCTTKLERLNMRYFWVMVNSALIALAVRGGYVLLTPDRLQHTNPGPLLCLVILLITPPFAVLIVAYSIRRRKSNPLLRPSWSRNPLNWWRDPLQALFISTSIMTAMTIGAAVRRPTFGSVAFWTLGVYVCFAVGLFVGQVLVYRIYRQRIASNWLK